MSRGDVAAYESKITGRNLLTEYKEQPRQGGDRLQPPANFDVAKHSQLTAIVAQDNEPGITIYVKPTGDKFDLREGDEFEVGGVTYKVVQIGVRDRDAILSSGGKRKQVHLGDYLGDAVSLPDDGT